MTRRMRRPSIRGLGLETLARQTLARLGGDSALVDDQFREWWLAYLASHESHLISLFALTVEWGPQRERAEPTYVADVGSFPGHCAVLLSTLGYRVAAIDIDPDRAGHLWNKYGIAPWKRDIERENLPFRPKELDFAVLAEVLEHLRLNPFKPLREIHRALKPGGRLLVSVPYVSPRHRIRFLLGRDYQGDIIASYRSEEEVGHMGHYRLLSRGEVKRMLAYAGFAIRHEAIDGWLPGGRWSAVRYLGPLRSRFRSHLYVIAEKSMSDG